MGDAGKSRKICRYAESEQWDAPRHYAVEESGRWMQIEDPFTGEEIKKTGEEADKERIQLLAPCLPSKIVCVGLNYLDHAEEMNHNVAECPLIFLKPPSALCNPNDHVVYPRQSQQVEHEVELGVVIGKRAKNVAEEEALDYVFGYTVLNDVTARDLQKKDGQWTRAKGFDTFCPVGPWIVTNIEWKGLDLFCRVNNELRQQGNTSHMRFEVPQLISFISKVMTLLPGDVIATGTPSGVGPMRRGDVVEAEIAHIGVLRNRIG